MSTKDQGLYFMYH